MKPDEIDLKILGILQEDSRTSNVEISRRLKMAPSGILERVRKLKERGFIREFTARLDPDALEMGLLAFISLKTGTEGGKWDVGAMAAAIPEVLEVHDVAGEDCYILKVRTRDTDSLYRLLRDQLGQIGSVLSSRTTIVLRTVKETSKLPLPAKAPAGRRTRSASAKGSWRDPTTSGAGTKVRGSGKGEK